MARKAPIITLDELKSKMSKYIKSYNDPSYDDDDEEFPYNLPEKVNSDLAKIEFDFENYSLGDANPNYADKGYSGYPCGYKILPSGIPVLLVNAGGDWEFPICFALYYDGKGIRGYIPTDGNVFDKKNKSAYGNSDEEIEEDNLQTLVNPEAIINDINSRIEVK
jgi:hypothetical protein